MIIVDKKKVKTKEYTGGAGALARRRYNFDPRHPLADSYIQCVRNRGKSEQFPVPRLTEIPPRPPKHTSNQLNTHVLIARCSITIALTLRNVFGVSL